jgi:hypothetical protein
MKNKKYLTCQNIIETYNIEIHIYINVNVDD